MQHTRRQLSLLIAFVASLLIHFTVLVPMIAAMATSQTEERRVSAELTPEDFHQPSDPPNPELKLGIDQGTPSTFTWVGFDEYEKHLAARAEFEQAAFTRDTPHSRSPDTEQPHEEQNESETKSEQENPIEILESQTVFVNKWLDSVSESFATVTGNTLRTLLENPRVPQEVSAEQTKPAEQQLEHTTTEVVEEVGVQSDKESDPTSVVNVSRDQWQLGKPLAAEGLELKPSRPSFTVLTLLTASPGNPLCEIEFDSDGVPTIAQIIEPSGDPRVDDAILASLYRWRATGKGLEKLEYDQTIKIRIRILLLSQQ